MCVCVSHSHSASNTPPVSHNLQPLSLKSTKTEVLQAQRFGHRCQELLDSEADGGQETEEEEEEEWAGSFEIETRHILFLCSFSTLCRRCGP